MSRKVRPQVDATDAKELEAASQRYMHDLRRTATIDMVKQP